MEYLLPGVKVLWIFRLWEQKFLEANVSVRPTCFKRMVD